MHFYRSIAFHIPGLRSLSGHLSRAASLLLSLVGLLGCIHAAAQSATTKTLAIPPVSTFGFIQGSDGNFYSEATGSPLEATKCPGGDNDSCAFIYKTTPSGTVSVFHAFQEVPGSANNTDGLAPSAFFEGADGNFYGACQSGGPYGLGTIFKITPGGVTSVLYAFASAKNAYGQVVPVNGYAPLALIQGSDGALYGTANGQAINAASNLAAGGLFFKLTTDGTFSVLAYFSGMTDPATQLTDFPQGGDPDSILQGSDGNFYLSMAIGPQSPGSQPSSGGYDVVTPGGKVSAFYAFTSKTQGNTNSASSLVEGNDGSFYGTGYTDASPNGLVFRLSPSGTLTSLHDFTSAADGVGVSSLTLGSDGNLYGTAFAGGTQTDTCEDGCGTFFQLQPSGAYTVLHDFTGGIAPSPTKFTGVDGAHPDPNIVQSQGGVFFGTTGGSMPGGVLTNSPTVYSLALTDPIPPPVKLFFSVKGVAISSVAPDTAVTLTWEVLNAFSQTAQQCHASILGSPIGAGDWSGPQNGSIQGGLYTGTATITPSASGTFTYALNCGGVETGMASLTVSGVSITTPSIPPGVVSIPYNAALSAIGGVGPYTWGALAGLPAGLSVNATTGAITGTPTQFGAYLLMIGLLDSSKPPQTGAQTYSLNIVSGLMLAGSLNNDVVGTAYNATAKATGGLPPYKWALTSGKLPAGLTLNTTSGVITGTPTTAAKYTFSITVTDAEPDEPASFTQSYTVSTAVPPLTVVPFDFPDCTLHTQCQGQFSATGGTPPYTWTLVPGTRFLPGLTLSSNGSFSGLPTQYNILPPPGNLFINNPNAPEEFFVRVTDSETPAVTVSTSGYLGVLSGLKIVSIPLPNATAGVAYQAPAPTATGGTPPYTWKVGVAASSGLDDQYGVNPAVGALYSLPGGPVSVGTFPLTYIVTDSEGTQAMGTQATDQASATLTVLPVTVTSVTTLSSSSSSAGTGMPITLTAKVAATGSVPSGTVTFYNGSTVLGTGTLDATATATLTTSFPAVGVYSLTAAYAGAGSTTGSTSAALTETIVAVGVTSAITPATLTIARGSSGTLAITVTPTGGYTGTVKFSCGTLPANITCTFAPTSLTLTAGSGPITDTLTINTGPPKTAILSSPMLSSPSAGSGSLYLGLLLWLPGPFTLLSALLQRKRKHSRPRNLAHKFVLLTFLCLSLAAAASLAGCGGNSSPDAKAGTYTIPVNLTLASGPAQTVNATILVQ